MTDTTDELDRTAERFNPFPGLRPFEPDEDHLFFGRERETDELLRRLRTNRFVSVLGTSGSGKSSLVRSGLIPSLHSGFMVQAGSAWRIAILRPGEDPIGNLAAALDDPDVLGDDAHAADAARVILETTLRRSSLGLADCVQHAHLPEHDNLLVVVDQFEELFRFRETRNTEDSRGDAIAFAKLLLAAASQTDVPLYVVITMRSDFVGDCMEYPGLPEAINEGQYLIPRMTRDEIRKAIVGPVAVGQGEIAPRLVSRVLNEVGDDPDRLPVLQHALMRTWDHWSDDHADDEPLDVRHYEAVGTMAEALSRHADLAYAELTDDRDRETAERMFKALTDKRFDDRGVRRPTPVAEIAEIARVEIADVIRVVEVFRRPGRSFLMPPAGVTLGASSVLDLSHESLMRKWARLAEWVDQETTSGKAYRRLCRAARRHRHGQAGLWVEPELSLGLKWRSDVNPNATWAHRYDPDFELGLEFLDASLKAKEEALREEEAARRAKLRRARILAGVLGTAAVITLIFGLLAIRAGRIARQAEARAQGEAETASAVTSFLVGLFEVVDPETGQGDRITAREILDQGAERIDAELGDQPEVRARMKGTVGKVYGSLGLYDDAEPLLRQAVETAETTLGPDHPQTLEARHRLAEVEWSRGRYREAESLYVAVLAERRRVLGERDPAALATLAGLGRVRESLGLYPEAETAAREAFDAQREVLGAGDPSTLKSLHQVGKALFEQGRYVEAESVYVETWHAQTRALGESHPQTLATMSDLGQLYTDLGRYAEADSLYAKSLRNISRVYGDEHPKTLQARKREASLNFDRGFWARAEETRESVLEVQRRVLGPEHPSTLDTETILAWTYNEQDRRDEGERLARHAYEVARRTLGEEHRMTREAANVLGAVLEDQGRYAESESLYVRNLEINERRYGPAHPSTMANRNNLAVLYSSWGRRDESERLYQENLDIARATYGDDNPSTLFYMNNMAFGYRNQGRLPEAVALGKESLERHERLFGTDHPQTLNAIRALAFAEVDSKHFAIAESLGTESLARHRRIFGADHQKTLGMMAGFGWFYMRTDRPELARPLFEEVLEGRRRVFGEEHPSTISAYSNMAWLEEEAQRPEAALAFRRRAMECRRTLATREGAGPHDKHRYASALVAAERALRDPDAAVRFAEVACEMTDHRDRRYVATLANAYFLAGRTDDAITTMERAIALVPPEDPRPRNWLEERLAEFHAAAGNSEPKRRMKVAEIARKKEAAETENASPRAKDRYAWELLTALPTDLRDPEEAMRVALAANEEGAYANADHLNTLALAHYQAGQRKEAVRIQERLLALLPEDDIWDRPNNENLLVVYRGDVVEPDDLTERLVGSWWDRSGGVDINVEFRREGDYVVGYSGTELPWVPKGEAVARFDTKAKRLELRRSDSGWTNLRWEPADYRFTSDGDLITWAQRNWRTNRFTKE